MGVYKTKLLPNKSRFEQEKVVVVVPLFERHKWEIWKHSFHRWMHCSTGTLQLSVFPKQCQCRLLKPRAKHPVKIHIWGEISIRGATNVGIFSGIMDAPRYQQILVVGLLPFLNECFPDVLRVQQDNDPKYCSNHMHAYW